MNPKIAKLVHDKLLKGDVEWLSRDSFRIWTYDVQPYEGMNEPGDLKQLELVAYDFEIKQIGVN